jgi:NADH-quinone oxidoreductase subunit L
VSEPIDQLTAWLIPLAPLASAVIIALFGKLFGEGSHRLTVTGLLIAFFCAARVLVMKETSEGTGVIVTGAHWLSVGSLQINVDIRIDTMTAIMLCMVTFVSTLVAIYASGYMHGQPGYPRFFAALSLFVFSMCMLVLSNNFLMLFCFWEAVGLCSYLLIGFWFSKPSAAAAAKKAFVVNRIGDFGFMMGIFLLLMTFGTLDYDSVFKMAGDVAEQHPQTITIICLLLFVGAMGKSAQAPLHVWLPDAMEGPTPVSALIHAATMVTAGVYMVARCTPLFVHAPTAQLVVAGVGAVTALLAAFMGMTQYDLKRVLAYSTVSQLGFMFMGLGSAAASPDLATAAVTAAMFHLFTHAFFKALLFLGAGSVMHAMGDVIDMRRFSGLRRLMPKTHITFLCGSLALAGFPLLSGFWSKDEILAAVMAGTHEGAHPGYFKLLSGAGLLTSLMTAFYTFRAYFMTFWGEERIPEEAGHHAHESPASMTTPLMILAIPALLIGGLLGPTGFFGNFLGHTVGLGHEGEHHLHWDVMAISAGVALAGIFGAWLFYVQSPGLAKAGRTALAPLYHLSLNQLYLDQLFNWILVKPLWVLGWVGLMIERFVIDAALDFIAWVPNLVGKALRPLQNGLVQSYALVMALGLAAILAAMMLR